MNVGMVCLLQADYPLAKSALDRTLTINLRELGPNHPRVAWTRATLGGLMMRMGRPREAATEYRAALAALEASIGLQNPDAGRCYRGLGDVALEQRRMSDADSMYARAHAVFIARGGPRSGDVPPTLRRIGVLRLEQGRLDDAVETLTGALDLGVEVYERDDHPGLAETLVALARARTVKGEQNEAERLLRRALAIAEKAHGADHPDVAEALHGLGQVLAARGQHDEAQPCFDRALDVREKRLGPSHPDTRATARARATLVAAS
jgi:tetratricopeptide (TPR) repeat protein